MKKSTLKKITLAAVSALYIMSGASQPGLPAYSEDTVYYYGDLNGDKVLDVFDLCMMRQAYLHPETLDALQSELCDMSANDSFDDADLIIMQDYLLGRISTFPSGPIYTPPAEPQIYNGQRALNGSRQYEYLDRGVYAVNAGNSVFVSWRLLAQDERDIGFNVYRITDGKTVKLNQQPLKGGTNFSDTKADMGKDNTYYVTTVYNDVETPTDGSYTLKAGGSIFTKGNMGAAQIIPIRPGGLIHFVWVGDFNKDGKYDFLVDRCADEHQKLEAYLNDGTYLWTIDMGVNSENKNNISPGPSTIDVGMWDGATVYDIDEDGSAEVIVRIADGVTFGDGKKFSNNSGGNGQAIAVLNGMTGSLEASVNIPQDYLNIGPMACMMEIGYLDGINPSLVCWMKNRNKDKSFNSLMAAYGYAGGNEFRQLWKYDLKTMGGAEAHQFRVEDVDYNGTDEVLHMGYALNGDGSLRYRVKDVVHGDRYHITAFSNSQNGKEMWGYGVQQRNPNKLLEYIYNASTGELIWTNYGGDGSVDIGRGDIGDVDPSHEGYEVWSFQGMYNMNGKKISDTNAYPSLKLYWDGDLLSESYNNAKIEKWHYDSRNVERLATTWKITGCTSSDRGAPMFYGDILGDWREEIICVGPDFNSLVLISTTAPSEYRINCLAQDPAYRNDMTSKGYYQSNMVSYYLGNGMDAPPVPDISYIGSETTFSEDKVWGIRNVNSGRCMDVYKSGTKDGTNVQQYGTVANKSNNTWRIKDAGEGYVYIISQLSNGRTGYLTVENGADSDGANVIISSFTGNDEQKFRLKNSGGGYVILTKCSDEKRCIEVEVAAANAGANVQQWALNGNSCQSWKIENIK